MKLREKFKRFWTMDVHNHEGFTLVELIIVIAILAILSGVAVAGYSSYIKKANDQADRTLVAEIKNSLTLAYYTYNGEVAGDFVLLLPNANAVAGGPFAEEAMAAAFGSNWKTSLRLKSTNWVANTEMLKKALAAGAVNGSSYLTNSNVNELLGNVQHVTSAAAGLLGSVSRSESQYLTLLEGAMGHAYMERAAATGVIGKNEDGTYFLKEGTYTDNGDTITVSTDLQNQLSNLMVFGVADQMQGATQDEMSQMMLVGLVDGVEVDMTKYTIATVLAARFAFYKAYALDCGKEEEFNKLNEDIVGVSGTTEAEALLNAFLNDNKAGLQAYVMDANTGGLSETFNTNVTAITQIMGGVNSAAPDYATGNALSNGSLFTSDAITGDLNAFIGMAALGEGLSAEQIAELQTLLASNPNAVVIIITNGTVTSTID